ncbi:MAG: FAD-dependent oxidoreductase [Saprospiraceae bacterium]|nr:FAD-dependent oxidoreductase [Saprospiraceae bacterium]MBP7679498.1 FAD-dependent oxidoreductase [Saprospiraceae bacterium]
MLWHEGIVTSMLQESPTTLRIWVTVPAVADIPFRPGQFVVMDLPISNKRLERWRSYSIANAPTGGNVLEFCIAQNPQGNASRYFFEEVTMGTTLRFKAPSGVFVLPLEITTDLVMICTGTGVAPFRSMLHYIYNNCIPHKKIHLIFGTRYASGILYQKEFEQLEKTHSSFRYDVVLSREENSTYLKGYVQDLYKKFYAPPRGDIHFYLCGWQQMIDASTLILTKELRFAPSQIHAELYG